MWQSSHEEVQLVVVWIEGMPGTVQTSNAGQDLVEWSCQSRIYIGSWVALFV